MTSELLSLSDVRRRRLLLLGGLALLMGLLLVPATVQAQEPTQRELRTFIPPDQLVSFSPSTPFDTFIEFVSPIFKRVTGKEVLDPETRGDAIGVDIARMHFLDALELVLEAQGLTYRETDKYFVVEELSDVGGAVAGLEAPTRGGELPATLDSREIKISAIFFELDQSRSRDLGINWDAFFGSGGSASGSGSNGGSNGGSSTGGTSATGVDFTVRTDRLFEQFDEYLVAPEEIDVTTLTQFFRLLERSGFGETIANPSITVQSDEQGRIQIGSDVPVQTRDFAGNTVTQFFSTGVIVEVLPTLITQPVADTSGAPFVDFIHMDVNVENSSSSPSSAGAPVINKSVAQTQVLLLDGEQTIIGGLYSTEESVSRKGIPILKDLPGWFFGLRYVFGRTQRTISQNELLIVLQARVLDQLEVRSRKPRPDGDLLQRNRQDIREVLRRFSDRVARDATYPDTYTKD